MTHDDHVVSLFERGNPVPDPEALPPAPPLSTIRDRKRQRTTTVTFTETRPDAATPRPARPEWRLVGAVAAAAIVVIGGLLILMTRAADDGEPADQPEFRLPPATEPAVLGATWVAALDSRDHETALSLLADDAQIQMLGSTDPAEFDTMLDHLEATDTRYDDIRCEFAEPTVTCRADFTNAWFEPLGAEPTESIFFLRIEGNKITALRVAEQLPDEVWSSWSKFVAEGDDGDWGKMAKSHADGFGVIGPMMTDESVALHRSYTEQFVEANSRG